MKSFFLDQLELHPDWEPFFSKEMLVLISQIEKKIASGEFTPSKEKVLRFFELPLKSSKVIILGQDPYPQPGAATGRAFEVGTLISWNEPFRNVSLKNILRAMYKCYSNKVLRYNDLKQKFDNEFPVLPPNKLFKNWEKQGVLLLNTSFTCEIGKPGSHKLIWEKFTFSLLNFINEQAPEIMWFLWGNHACEATKHLNLKNTVIAQHPMMCYEGTTRENDFLFGKINCFKQLQNSIDWTGFGLQKNYKQSGLLF